jgi:hypothetical protein
MLLLLLLLLMYLAVPHRQAHSSGRQFYSCSKPMSEATRCKYFKWADEVDGSGIGGAPAAVAAGGGYGGGYGGSSSTSPPVGGYGGSSQGPAAAAGGAAGGPPSSGVLLVWCAGVQCVLNAEQGHNPPYKRGR